MSYTTYRRPRHGMNLLWQAALTLAAGILLYFSLLLAGAIAYRLWYAGRILPGITVAGVDVSGLQPDAAAVRLNQSLPYPYNGRIVFRDGQAAWVVTPAQLGMVFDPSSSAMAAYGAGRAGLFLPWTVRFHGMEITPVIVLDQRVAYQYLSGLSTQIDRPMLEASLSLQGTDVAARPGQVGRLLDIDATLAGLTTQLESFRDGEVPLVIRESPPLILDVSSQADTARRMLSAPLTIAVPDACKGDTTGPWTYDVAQVAGMLFVQKVDNGSGQQLEVLLEPSKLRYELLEIAPLVNRDPENARFTFNDETKKLEVLEPAKIGCAVDVEGSITAINQALQKGEHTVTLQAAYALPPAQTSATGEELGIRELIHSETSYFYGSKIERIQNIQTAASRFHGLLIAPGETFSMGQALGDVSLDNGYAEALIIYGDRTIKGVGGGVCQVSTTLFRAAFFTGFPIVERHAHAYRVGYYEYRANGRDPRLAGLDATVFVPLVDFKFTNDTPYWLLMETYVNVDARTLTWKFYSTSDGRTVEWETTGPINTVEPPPALFEEDPELGPGDMVQVDWAAQGADVAVTRTVYRNGEYYFNDQFNTHYEAWQAVCQYGPGMKNPQKIAERRDLCQ
jgi:vancomycin resistance protein YoaR